MITIADSTFDAPAPETAGESVDAQLARHAAAGDSLALADLVRRHARDIHNLCFHLAGGADASDATQEALEKIVARIGAFDSTKGAFRSWALTVARHTCTDRLRRRSRERRAFHQDGESETALAPTEAPDPERIALARLDAGALQHALEQLPEPMRAALVLFHVHEASYEEIASALEVPLGTVMTWLHRGRKRLREALEVRSEETP